MAIKNFISISAAAGWPGGFRGKYPNGGTFSILFKTFHDEKATVRQRCPQR